MKDYFIIKHRKHGFVLVRRVPRDKYVSFFIWHDEAGRQHHAQCTSKQIENIQPAIITAGE